MGIVVTDSHGVITNINPFALIEFGYEREELIGKKIEVLIPSRFHHTHVPVRENYIHHPQNRAMGVGLDLFAVRKDGTEFPVEVSLGNYENAGNKYAIAFLSNISIRKRSEAEIEKLNNRLEATVEERTKKLTDTMHELERSKEELAGTLEKEKELGELKSRFVSMASHEFRTPLSTVLSSAYLIEKYTSGEDQPKRDKHIERIISSVNMLTDILNDFLSVGKIEEGKIQVRPVLFNITDYTKAVCEEIKNTLKEGQRIIYDSHKGATEVFLDPSLLKHIFMNLISNASKFSPPNSTIRIETTVTNKKIDISLTDSGIGISQEDQKHLTERFFRATNASNIQGTGLGLHIVSKYAELMNGTVECKSQLNSGTQFIISFIKKFPDE
jgi:PAS domain S-box-containing protein